MIESKCTGLRILIVDDFPEWRLKVRAILLQRPDWKIVGEAGDGSEAALKAVQLQPNVIILDLGMPRMNGFEVAKLIKQNSPSTAIVFLSENRAADIKQAALSKGDAYVLKRDANVALLPAIEAVQAASAIAESDALSSRT